MSAACHACGDSRRLRYDRRLERWECWAGCARDASRASPRLKKAKRAALFDGYWLDPASGERLGRVSQPEMAEVWRLWRVHRDIREGRPCVALLEDTKEAQR